jgi:hypothetical protein
VSTGHLCLLTGGGGRDPSPPSQDARIQEIRDDQLAPAIATSEVMYARILYHARNRHGIRQ